MAIEASHHLQTECLDEPPEPEPSIALVNLETLDTESLDAQTDEAIAHDVYDRFLREAGATLSSIGVFTIRHETAMVRLVSGDVIGNDYGEGLFYVDDPAGSQEEADNQTALRLRWAAAAAVVNEKEPRDEAEKFEGSPEELQQHLYEVEEHNKILRTITHEAISLHFKLRSGQTLQAIHDEIEAHFEELSQREISIYQNRVAFRGAIAAKTEVEAEEVSRRLEHSLHRHRKLRSVIYGLQLGKFTETI